MTKIYKNYHKHAVTAEIQASVRNRAEKVTSYCERLAETRPETVVQEVCDLC